MDKFWKWLAMFAWKQIKIKTSEIKFGVPGIRDANNPCESFMPSNHFGYDYGNCNGDGHYLCNKCRFYNETN